MFIAQIDEKDVYDRNFQQVQDINSLTEYLQQVFSHHKDHKPTKDSDDDNARYFHVLKPHFFLLQPVTIIKKEAATPSYLDLPPADDAVLASGFYDIQSPPPKA